MRYCAVRSDQVIIPGDEVRDMHILKLYHWIFSKGVGEGVLPLIIAHKDSFMPKYDIGPGFDDGLASYLERNPQAEYFLIDGCHKAVASSLLGMKHHALKLEDDSHLDDCRKMVEEGALLSFEHKATSLDELSREYGRHLYQQDIGGKSFLTVKSYVDHLVLGDLIPERLAKQYRLRNGLGA